MQDELRQHDHANPTESESNRTRHEGDLIDLYDQYLSLREERRRMQQEEDSVASKLSTAINGVVATGGVIPDRLLAFSNGDDEDDNQEHESDNAL